MQTTATILTAVLVGGCAAATDKGDSRREDMQYQRENERIEALERFQELRRSCARSGGVVFVERHNGGRLARTPTADEMKGASCTPATVF